MQSQSEDEQWARVWREMTEAELEDRVRMYMWLAANTPNSHASRVAQLIAECNRRGKPDIVERVRVWLTRPTNEGGPGKAIITDATDEGLAFQFLAARRPKS